LLRTERDMPSSPSDLPSSDLNDSQYRSGRSNLLLFTFGILMLGMMSGIYETTFNNFLSDTFSITARERGMLEFPRELPGFAVVFMTGLLFFLPETKIAALATLSTGLGLFGLALWGHNWTGLLICTVVWSIGTHIMIVLRSTLSLGLAHQQQKGRRLGQINGVNTAATIIGAGLVWILMEHFRQDYALLFIIGGAIAVVGSIIFWQMRIAGGNLKRPKFVWRRKYWLFYAMALVFGARKQIFITFAPWVLVRLYDQPASVMAKLWIVASALGIFFHPFLGQLVDRWGEKTILTLDSLILGAVCVGYGASHLLESRSMTLWILYACFVVDNMLFGVNMARATYLTKIAARKEDVSPTLSLGTTLDHAVSMIIPFFGGMLWMSHGHSAVFMFAGGVAATMFILTRFIPSKRILDRIRIVNGN